MTAIVNETVSVKKKPSGRRVIFASAFGNALEFFDFGVYNFFCGLYQHAIFSAQCR